MTKWKIVQVDGTPNDGELCICKYDEGENGWEFRFNHYVNGVWFSQRAEDDREPNYYIVFDEL